MHNDTIYTNNECKFIGYQVHIAMVTAIDEYVLTLTSQTSGV